MPSWLVVFLFLVVCVLLVGLQAAGVTGKWRAFWTACRQYGTYVLVMAGLAGLMWAGFMLA